MLSDLKFSFVNIDQESLSNELGAKVKYYANVIHWTLIYSLPLFWLLDYSFVNRLAATFRYQDCLGNSVS